MHRTASASSSCSDLAEQYTQDAPKKDSADLFFEGIDKTGIPSNTGKIQPWQEILRNHPKVTRADGKVLLKCTKHHDYNPGH